MKRKFELCQFYFGASTTKSCTWGYHYSNLKIDLEEVIIHINRVGISTPKDLTLAEKIDPEITLNELDKCISIAERLDQDLKLSLLLKDEIHERIALEFVSKFLWDLKAFKDMYIREAHMFIHETLEASSIVTALKM
jgi:hypothetical protein